MDKPYMLEFPRHGDDRGWLVVVEGMSDIPFDIKRIFYITGQTPMLCGKACKQKKRIVLINVCGSCKVKTYEETEAKISLFWTSLIREYISRKWCGRICIDFSGGQHSALSFQ